MLGERKRWMAAVSHGRPEVRITMTYPVIESSRRIAFLVAGKEKAAIFSAIRAGNSQVPAARVQPVGELFWFVDQAAAGEGQAAMTAKGYAAEVIEMEVTDSKQVDAAAARVMNEKGRIDILVCNAGIARSETAAEDVTDEHWLNVIDVNLNGLFWCCRAFGRHMLAAGRGSIVNIG